VPGARTAFEVRADGASAITNCRNGGSLVTVWVPDARSALAELAVRGGPEVELDDSTSDKVLFAVLGDPDGNAVTVVQVREGVTL
jgi:hypothetical protein